MSDFDAVGWTALGIAGGLVLWAAGGWVRRQWLARRLVRCMPKLACPACGERTLDSGAVVRALRTCCTNPQCGHVVRRGR